VPRDPHNLGPPGTGKTLLVRAVASSLDTNFLKVVSSAIVDKYIGESARLIREMFGYAKDHEPCIIFMDEIDAIGGRRFSEGTSADREIQRTLMELLNQLDGFDYLGIPPAPSFRRFLIVRQDKTHHGDKSTRYT
jgi:26S proteasome regulatory subunit T4